MSAQVPRGGHRHPKSNSWGCWNMAIFTWIYHDLARIYPQLTAENGKMMVHEWTFWREPSGSSSGGPYILWDGDDIHQEFERLWLGICSSGWIQFQPGHNVTQKWHSGTPAGLWFWEIQVDIWTFCHWIPKFGDRGWNIFRDEQTCGSMIVALTVKSRCWMLVSVAGNYVKNLHFGCYPRVDSGQSVHDPPFRWLKANGFPGNFPWYQPPQRWTSWILLKILVTFLSFSGLLGKTNPWCQKSQKSSSGHWFSREHHRMGGALIWWRIINLWISWDTLGYHEDQLGL